VDAGFNDIYERSTIITLFKEKQISALPQAQNESKMLSILTRVDERTSKLEVGFRKMEDTYIRAKRKEADPWTSSKRTKSEQADFKDELIKFYEREDKTSGKLLCMVLNEPFPSHQVRAAHIWKYCTFGAGLPEYFKLDIGDIQSPRNGLLLCEGIKQAFDVKGLCFLYDFLHGQLVLRVLDPDLKGVIVKPSISTKFDDINNMILSHPPGKVPFRRILSWHAECAFTVAFARGWITKAEHNEFKDYTEVASGVKRWDTKDSEESSSV